MLTFVLDLAGGCEVELEPCVIDLLPDANGCCFAKVTLFEARFWRICSMLDNDGVVVRLVPVNFTRTGYHLVHIHSWHCLQQDSD